MRTLLSFMLLTSVLSLPALVHSADAGETAPLFTLPLLTQEGLLSLDSYKGKVVYVDFWASWCGPCRKSLPLLSSLRTELKDKGFEVLAINLDDDIDDARSFIQQYPVSYPTLYDGAGKTSAAFGLRGMPTSYLLDRSGRIQAVHQGFKPSNMEAIRSQINNLLTLQ